MTFESAVQRQCDYLLRAARRLDERGYAVIVHRLNPESTQSNLPFGYFNGALEQYAKCWIKEHKCKSVLVHIWPHAGEELLKSMVDGKVFDRPFTFIANVPRALRCRGLVAALELMSSISTGRGSKRGAGIFHCSRMSDRFEFKGEGRNALEAMLRMLDMPQHRELLTKGK